MKNLNILIIAVMFFSACQKDTKNISPDLMKNKWEVSYFWDKDKDETYHFTNWEFSFEDNGILKASKSSDIVTGTWIEQSSSNSNSKLIINFGQIEPFDELNDDWHIIERTSSIIKLEDESGSGGTEILHFRKK